MRYPKTNVRSLAKALTACTLAWMMGAACQAEVTAGLVGWSQIEGIRRLPLRALELHTNGTVVEEACGRLACRFGKQHFGLRIGTPNIFTQGRTDKLSCDTTRVDGQIYVAVDLPHKLGWTCRPTPAGYRIRRPGSDTNLEITRGRWKSEPHRPPSDSDMNVGIWYITLYYPKGQGPYYWDSVKDRKGAAMPSRGPYLLADPKVIERQWREMCECGIDFILMDDTNTVHVDNNGCDKNIRAWFDWMDKLPEDERIKMAIAAGGELNQHGNKAAWTKAVDYLWNTYASRPSYLHDKGKPVLHWYIETDVWDDWDDLRWTVRRTYHFFRTADQVTHGGWGYGSDRRDRCIEECLSFHPGWDLSPPGHTRDGGDLYRKRWINVLKCKPRHVLIACWNGWIEGDAIEDSDSWKDTYGDAAPSWYRLLTQGYVAAYKGGLIEGFYYRDEAKPHVYLWRNEGLVYQRQYPHKTPVIVLPAGLLEKLVEKPPSSMPPSAGSAVVPEVLRIE